MPIDSSIYWDSIGSQRSTSGGSSGGSSGSAGRHYVDPWDLENYAYLRRHSIAGPPQQLRHGRSHRTSRDARANSEYWCTSLREPGYVAPGFVEELYYGPPRQPNNGCYYHQPIYEDEVPNYAPFPVYAPLPEVQHAGLTEDYKRFRHRCRSSSIRELERSEYGDPGLPAMHIAGFEEPRHRVEEDYPPMSFDPIEQKYVMEVIPPPHLDLNTYGHLKIDYTQSWNSLNRKISK